MKSFSGKLTLAVAAAALLTTAAYAQTPPDAVHPDNQGAVSPRIHHAHSAYDRHAYHTGSAHHAAAIYNQATEYGAADTGYGTGSFGPTAQPLYDAAVAPVIAPYGVVCIGGRGVGYYPNPSAYGDAASNIESGGQFTLDRGYPGCFAYPGE
jgi:hypothetical protein